MKTLRKLVSILLLALIGLPFASPLFALTAKSESNLPACCRRAGRHHCLPPTHLQADNTPRFNAPVERCPYAPASIVVAHHSDPGLAPSDAIFAALVSHPAVHAQLHSKQRIARDRSRDKRGPPSLSLL
jgi:hypothetical protein